MVCLGINGIKIGNQRSVLGEFKMSLLLNLFCFLLFFM